MRGEGEGRRWNERKRRRGMSEGRSKGGGEVGEGWGQE